MKALVEIKGLSVFHRHSKQEILKDISLTINKGEIVALVGASGSGKSLLAEAIFHILPSTMDYMGKMLLQNHRIEQSMNGKKIVLVPQSVNALDPLMKIGKQIQLFSHDVNRIKRILNQLQLTDNVMSKYPFQLSGGQARRILVATALISNASFIVADEPTPGLDEQARHEMLQLLKSIQSDDRALLMITHDFQAAQEIADKIAVLYQGEIVEVVNKIAFDKEGSKLVHPYTKALWKALPENYFSIKGTSYANS
ncbi:ATP-binding cassette domain-containing protein [Gracilibacillus xinjiangensis]|uniref:Nickel import system ATP-binding protein NikD n=1 Tax=Gracilibacillus xinjiangensis TaxID=1193282 RepID=A0ABV8WTH3_9BACI